MTLAAAALLLAASVQPASETAPWRVGERLAYTALLDGARAGEVTLSIDGGGPAGWQVGVEARQASLLGAARFSARSALSGALRPGRFQDLLEGWGDHRTSDAQLDLSPNAVRIAWSAGGRQGANAYLRRAKVLDFASAVPWLRAAALAPGQAFSFDLVGATRYWRVDGRASPRLEAVPTPAGRFEALRLDAVMASADRHADRVPVRLWLSADPSHLPVAAELETSLGRVRVELVHVAGGPG